MAKVQSTIIESFVNESVEVKVGLAGVEVKLKTLTRVTYGAFGLILAAIIAMNANIGNLESRFDSLEVHIKSLHPPQEADND